MSDTEKAEGRALNARDATWSFPSPTTNRARLRARYNAAEYRLIAGRALLKAAEEEAEAEGWPTEALETVVAERESVRSAERNVDAARAACEEAGVTINAHPATSIL